MKLEIILLYILMYYLKNLDNNKYLYYYKLEKKYIKNILPQPKKIIDLSHMTYLLKNIDNIEEFRTANISIIPYNCNYICVLRLTNFIPNLSPTNILYKTINVVKNYNILFLMDEKFNIIKHHFLNVSDTDKNCEDIRLFNKNNKIFFSCNYFDNPKKKIYKVIVGELNSNFDIKKTTKLTKNFNVIYDIKESLPLYNDIFNPLGNIKNVYEKFFSYKKNHEKNWTIFNYNKSIHIIYKWFPLHICKVNDDKLELIEIKNMPENFAFCRGSTNGYEYNNLIWFIIHKTTIKKNYYHLIAIFDKQMNLQGFVDDYKFENCTIEFCLGLIINNKNIIISYSTYDIKCKIAIYDKKVIESLINWL